MISIQETRCNLDIYTVTVMTINLTDTFPNLNAHLTYIVFIILLF